MTEYWVSQGNKWCDYCKIYIANNPASIRMHESGKRHKDNVQLKLSSMKKDASVKELQKKKAEEQMEKIEKEAKRQYEKDLKASSSAATAFTPSDGWILDTDSGYYLNSSTGYYYDPNSGLYYNEKLGKWVSQQEASSKALKTTSPATKPAKSAPETAVASTQRPSQSKTISTRPKQDASSAKASGTLPAAGANKTTGLGKRPRDASSSKGPMSAEEKAALEAREAARKRTQEREAKHLGLYG